MRIWALVFLIFVSPVAARAVGKVTVDPNVPGQAQKSDEPDDTDSRLGQKITYTVSARTVAEILDDLTRTTGVTFKAGSNSSDWQVRDRKMTISVEDVPLNRLMNSISRVMKFKWQRSGEDGKWTYRLYLDRKSLLDAEAQRVRAEERAEEARAKKRAEGVEKYAKLMDLTEEEKNDLRQTNPFLYMAAESGLGKSLGQFFKEVPAAFDAFANGRRLDLDSASLSPVAQSNLMAAIKDMSRIEQKMMGRERAQLDTLDPSKLSIGVNDSLEHISGVPVAGFMLGNMSVRYDGGKVDIPFLDPQSKMAHAIGTILIESQEQKRSISEVMKDHLGEFMDAVKTATKEAAATGEPLVEHPDDPAFKEEITINAASARLPDVELALAKEAKLPVVSDYFGSIGPLSGVPSGKMEIRKALDTISDTYNYNWDKHSEIIEFRDRNWFKKRTHQIPESRIDVWRKEVNSTGTIDLDGLSQIAQLTQEQYIQNVMADELLGQPALSTCIFGNQDLLKLYGSLSADQRRALMSGGGMDVGMLSPEQFAQTEKQLQAKLGTETVRSANSIAIACSREASQASDNKSATYRFTLYVDGVSSGPEWTLTTPVIKKKEDKKQDTSNKKQQ
ncbi:MAG: hypothetical protein ACOX3G_05735 [Armatimonadota bacterium]